jgi:hypothetical protein
MRALSSHVEKCSIRLGVLVDTGVTSYDLSESTTSELNVNSANINHLPAMQIPTAINLLSLNLLQFASFTLMVTGEQDGVYHLDVHPMALN